MKNILMIIPFILSVISVKAQTYVQGNGVLPFRSIANTSVLTDANRLNINDAFQNYNEYVSNTLKYSTVKEVVGEYYFQNNLLIKLISRNKDNSEEDESLEDIVDYYREMFTQNIYENEVYFVGEVIANNNFKCVIYYDTRNTFISFLLRDNAGKYNVMGRVIFKPNNLTNARVFFDSFINSLTFK